MPIEAHEEVVWFHNGKVFTE